MHTLDDVRLGSLVEISDGPLRVEDETRNFGIVAGTSDYQDLQFADIVTTSGAHRLIQTEYLSVISQPMKETR
jgi:hypothetical protein